MAVDNWIFYTSNWLNTDLGSGSYRMALVTSSYTPDQDAHDTWSDISANEVSAGSGYSTHGEAVTVTRTAGTNAVSVEFADTTWSTASFTYKYAVVVLDADANGSLATTDKVIAYLDVDDSSGSASVTGSGGDIVVGTSGAAAITSTLSTG